VLLHRQLATGTIVTPNRSHLTLETRSGCIFHENKREKLQSFFRTEGRIEGNINDATYIVSSPKWRDNRIIHVDKIKLITIFLTVSVTLCVCHVARLAMPRDRTIECLRHCTRFSVIRNEACNATFTTDEPYQRHVQCHAPDC